MLQNKYQDQLFKINDKTYGFIKWNWNYDEALLFQEEARQYIAENRDLKIFIFTSHPRLFTLGRGLQKSKSEDTKALINFDESMEKRLPFPLYRIKRGGGLTFHYPGQWIMYPIVNLNHPGHSLKELIYFMLENVKVTIEEHYHLTGLDYNRQLLGLWKEQHKLASVGIEIKKFITQHGLALNVKKDLEMFKELRNVNPCGLSSDIYRSMEDYLNEEIHLEEFTNKFLKTISDRN